MHLTGTTRSTQATPLQIKDASTLLKGLAVLCWTPAPSLLRQCIATLAAPEEECVAFEPDVAWLFWGAAYFGVPPRDGLMQEAVNRWAPLLLEHSLELTVRLVVFFMCDCGRDGAGLTFVHR